MFTTEQILEDFASFAEISREDWHKSFRYHLGAGDGEHSHGLSIYNIRVGTRTRVHALLGIARRPERRREDIADVLDERSFWTTKTILTRLSLPVNAAEMTSVGLIMAELGWTSTRSGTTGTVVFSRGCPLDRALGGAVAGTVYSASEIRQLGEGMSAKAVGAWALTHNWKIRRTRGGRIYTKQVDA